ncbi:MAG: tRNA uridine-5-carboxymethylaminomethyl(34) synthesis GTPase MnmE [Candidatus Aminicenantes bacterium]|nr:tRNA uridine-5-carboxymethylaminomethyl(34) synthesis GTPase MnmE [Candidatus Aminicenantes bacterium]
MNLDETIVAISTPPGSGGLGIVRLTGEKALPIVQSIFRSKKKLSSFPKGRPVLGHLFHPEKQELFEEAYVTFFPGPHSYTREDVVEISGHGSPVILDEIVRLCIREGARCAHPGEFTLRAFINGRIDIIQAEAINDLIHASSMTQARISFRQLQGSLSQKINKVKDDIIHILTQVEACLEFPDESLHISKKTINNSLKKTEQVLKSFIESYEIGKILSQGLTLAITGRTNTGKSTLFNTLINKKRAIVTPYPGTTRDYIQEKVKIGDTLFFLTDMAGINSPDHPADKSAVRIAQKVARDADGILILLDVSQEETPEDLKSIEKYKNKKAILVFNKIDLPQRMNINKILKKNPAISYVKISALRKTNIDTLRKKMEELFVPHLKEQDEIILCLRQKHILEDILTTIKKCRQLLSEGYPEEFLAEEIRRSVSIIGQLTGEIRAEDILKDIFKRFCVGK